VRNLKSTTHKMLYISQLKARSQHVNRTELNSTRRIFQFANRRVGTHALRTSRALTVPLSLQPISTNSGGFRREPSRLGLPTPPWLTDRDSVAVLLISDNCRTCTSEYSQYNCHQWLSRSFRVHQIRFRPGRAPLGSLQRSPRTPSWLKGEPYF